jgi:hypothetical protein
MEFSSGLFTNLNIETQREVAKGFTGPAVPGELAAPPIEVVSFTVKCNFAKSQTAAAANPPANQVALKK